MPTPFNHLRIALELPARLPAALQARLAEHQTAWLLGNIAPDAQTLSGQLREDTHFFPVPLGGAPPAYTRLFAAQPALSAPWRLPQAQAAFLSGYLTHLEFDQWWIREVFEPVFGPGNEWAPAAERIYLHNALRAWWDAYDLAALPGGLGHTLRQSQPHQWLAAIADHDLVNWRDFVADQLVDGAITRTAEVFAGRMRVDALDFAALVGSPDSMTDRVFIHFSNDQLLAYRAQAFAASLTLLDRYWHGDLYVEAGAG
jgi:hypothetical protein